MENHGKQDAAGFWERKHKVKEPFRGKEPPLEASGRRGGAEREATPSPGAGLEPTSGHFETSPSIILPPLVFLWSRLRICGAVYRMSVMKAP